MHTRIAIVSLMLFVLAFRASAQLIVDSSGFEEPQHVAGDLVDQEDWRSTSAEPLANVQQEERYSGRQALQVDRQEEDIRWAIPNLEFDAERFVTISWAMLVEPQEAESNSSGPFFGVEAYDDVDTFGLLGSLGVDATTGEVLYQVENTGFLTSAAEVEANVWHRFRMELDFEDNQYKNYLNGELISQTGFVDLSSGVNQLTDADISTFAVDASQVSRQMGGTAYFDEFFVLNGLSSEEDCNGDGIVNIQDANCTAVGSLSEFLERNGTKVGDLNGTGGVEFADFLIFSSNFGQTNRRYTDGDLDQNNNVGFRDFLELSANFGMGADFGLPEPETISPVPEPGPQIHLLIGLVVMHSLLRRAMSLTSRM